jgi:hypothetical protein
VTAAKAELGTAIDPVSDVIFAAAKMMQANRSASA